MARNPAVLVSLIADWDGKDLDKGIKELEKARAATQTMSDKVGAFGAKMQTVGKQIGSVGSTLTKSVTLPLVGIGAAATAMAVEFDSSMAKITALVGIASDEVDDMRKSVLDLSGATAKSPAELADALFVVTSAGLRGKDALNALEASAKAGAAGLGQTNDIARALAGAMNAYGPSVVDAARATDMIVATARAGNFETSQFAGAIGRVLPFAKQAGSSLEDMGGAVALLTRTNGDAAQSVTQVAALFRAFVVPTEEAKKALKDVGLSAGDVRKAISEDGLPAALAMLDQKLGGNREQLGKLLGSSEAASAAFQILDADAQSIADTFGAVNDATGITDEAFGVVAETTGFKLQQAFTSLKSSLIEFGDIIAPFVEQFAARIKSFADSFAALDPQTKKFIVAAGAVAAAVGPLLIIVGKAIIGIGGLAQIFGGITIAGSILAIKIIAVVAAVAAIALAFKAMWDRSEALRKAVGMLIDTVKNIAKTLLGDLLGAFRSVTGEAGSVRSIFDRVAKVAGDVLAGALNILTNWWKILANGVRVVIKVFEVQFKIITMVANLIRGALIAAIDIIMNRLGPVSTALRGFANGIKSGFTIVVNAVRGLFQNLAPALESFINFGIDAVNGLIRQYNKLAEVLPGVSKATEIARFQFSNFGGAAEDAAKSSTQLANEANAARYTAMAGVTDWSGYTAALADTSTETVDLGDDLGDLTNDLNNTTSGTDKAQEAAERYAKGLEAMKSRLSEWRKGLVKELDDAREEFFSFARQVSTAITGAINLGGAFSGAADRVQAIADAEKNLADARAEANKADAGADAGARVIAAEAQLAQARSQGERLGLTFMEALNAQAAKAREFAAQIQTLISMGINKDSPLMQMIIGEGAESGSQIAAELIAGGTETINQATDLLTAVQGEADTIGLEAAQHFKGAGVSSALATVQGFDEQFGPGGPGRKQLMRIMDRLAEKAKRGVEIEVMVTRRTNEIVERIVSEIRRPAGVGVEGAGARGAIVRRPTVALIGEAGPEALLPLDRTRGNAPISDLRGGGVTINVTAGLGTDGAEVGRQIVDALKAYERRNGAVYASA